MMKLMYHGMGPYMSDMFLAIIILGSISCLAPLFSLPNTASYDHFDDQADVSITKSLLSSQFNRETLTAGLFIVVIPAADLLLELTQNFFIVLGTKTKEERVVSLVIRLTNFERFLFILGVAIRSTAILVPVHNQIIQLVFDCTNNSSTILMTCPVMVFFARCTTTWTPSVTLVVILLTVVSNVLETSSFFFKPDSLMCGNLLITSIIMVFVAVFVVVLLTLKCLYKFTRAKIGHSLLFSLFWRTREVLFLSVTTVPNLPKVADKTEPSRIIDELYENYVPAAHMSIAIMVSVAYIVAAIARKTYPDLTPEIGGYENCWILICAICVLIVEYRIRNNEITRGLIREKVSLMLLLDSKKSYVRYISHELRTPLNTAFLGMRLLIKEFKVSNDPRDKERYETLTDMSLSCSAALDILNDLLCFEKLESGILDLHKQEVLVMPFLQDCMNMFAVQAREGAITMRIETDIKTTECDFQRPPEAQNPTSPIGSSDGKMNFIPLDATDVVMIDRFKMDQVIRNLISNALKFTPRGGQISVKVTFVPNDVADAVKSSSSVQKSSCPSARDSGPDRSPSTSCLYGRHGLRLGGMKGSVRKNRVAVGDAYVWDESGDLEAQLCSRPIGPFASLPSRLDSGKSVSVSGKLVIIVTDSGAGISENNQRRLFKEIVQFQPEILQAGGGSGLGLWITRGIVDLHNGKISVYSAGEGKGCSFTLEIPMDRAFKMKSPSLLEYELEAFPSFDPGPSLEDPPADTLSVNGAALQGMMSIRPEIMADLKMNILVVDDSRLNRKMLMKCLQADGHTCEEAEDGLEAILRVKLKAESLHVRRTYDAILMDFVMPNMDGPTATREIRALGYDAPIFGVTGNGLATDVAYFMGSGADFVLLKPLNMVDFYHALKQTNLI